MERRKCQTEHTCSCTVMGTMTSLIAWIRWINTLTVATPSLSLARTIALNRTLSTRVPTPCAGPYPLTLVTVPANPNPNPTPCAGLHLAGSAVQVLLHLWIILGQ